MTLRFTASVSSLAQLAERGPSKTKAGGSIPSGAIFDFISFFVRLYFGVSCCKGFFRQFLNRRFKKRHTDSNLAERRISTELQQSPQQTTATIPGVTVMSVEVQPSDSSSSPSPSELPLVAVSVKPAEVRSDPDPVDSLSPTLCASSPAVRNFEPTLPCRHPPRKRRRKEWR